MGATGFIFFSLFFCGYLWLVRKNFSIPGSTLEISNLLGTNLEVFKLMWLYIAFLLIFITGFLDDIYKFKSKIVFFPTLLSLVIIVFLADIKINTLSYPFNYLIFNDFIKYLITFIWLGLCLSATKFLDGLDGIVAIVGVIGLTLISFTTMLVQVNQPLIFSFSTIWIFGILGFLPFNLPDAKLYLGEAGSQIIGLLIGVFSIISGAKIATSITVLGWFIIDILLVFLVRIFVFKKSPLEGDNLHWHHRLLALGLNKTQVLLFTTLILVITSYFGIILETDKKILVILSQIIISIFFFIFSLKMAWNKLNLSSNKNKRLFNKNF